jgi:hypothetical protein
MPTKAEQARINGAKSTGPKTPEGLQRCREASVKHGMWVAHVSTFPHEDQVAYAALLTSATDQFRPRTCVESNIVGLLVDALWRAGRLSAMANSDIDREMFLIKRQTSTEHEAHELHLLAEQTSRTVQKLEARARHYTREIARLMAILRQLQALPVSLEASEVLNEMIELGTEEVPEPPADEVAQPANPVSEPPPARKPVQNANIEPQKGSVPQRK